jgi:hypothetical protein
MIFVSRAFRPSYYFFYLEGLRRIFPKRRVLLVDEGMPGHSRFADGCAVVVPGAPRPRLYLSANDHDRIDQECLDWADAYGMVNRNPAVHVERGAEKIHPIGPSFGVQAEWGRGTNAAVLAGLMLGTVGRPAQSRELLKEWKSLHTERMPETRYRPGPSDDDYVFFVSWPWKKHAEVNPPRARFIRLCRSTPSIRFEGGFAPRRRRDISGIDDITAPRRYPFAEYLEKTRRSAFSFNCPAVHNCHGWKLGEFLALGKAVISEPLSRSMPSPLVHGEHVHFVGRDGEGLEDAIQRLRTDLDYRRHLEHGARRYYDQHLAPQVVMRKLLGMGDA